jgi:hypothetical protein
MKTHFLPMSTNGQSSVLKVDRECGHHESYDAHGGTPKMLVVEVAAQPIHP